MNNSQEWDTSALPAALDQECHSIVKDLGGVKTALSDVSSMLPKVSQSISTTGEDYIDTYTPAEVMQEEAMYCSQQ